MNEKNAHRVYRSVGIWDLILTLPFALPLLNGIVITQLAQLNLWISPQASFPVFGEIHLFFVQLFGILAVLWAVVRIHRPTPWLATYDTVGRFIVALSMLLYTVGGGSAVPSLFVPSELGWGAAQAVCLWRTRTQKHS